MGFESWIRLVLVLGNMYKHTTYVPPTHAPCPFKHFAMRHESTRGRDYKWPLHHFQFINYSKHKYLVNIMGGGMLLYMII